jgi:hypothetical protein
LENYYHVSFAVLHSSTHCTGVSKTSLQTVAVLKRRRERERARERERERDVKKERESEGERERDVKKESERERVRSPVYTRKTQTCKRVFFNSIQFNY